jgi:uncharacterized protein
MSRILKAYETRFRWLLLRVNARQRDLGVQRLVAHSRRLAVEKQLSLPEALTRVYERLAAQKPFRNSWSLPEPIRFFCDAGLGGLARWLRAAGYETFWESGIDDDDLLKRARELKAVLLTTDSMLMERKIIRDRIIPAFWLPPALGIAKQLRDVFREFGLSLRERRCMSCGRDLIRGEKEALRDRIPPKTYRWRDEYFVCAGCGKLFWHGTHWERIQDRLRQLAEK